MELELIRIYFPNGTNGELLNQNKRLCSTIELPWLANKQKVSCIPEGKYELNKRYSRKFGWHLQVMNVPGRELILVHPANDAINELKGCIAPVSILTGEGTGKNSKLALKKILASVYVSIERKEKIFITIKSSTGETNF